jgi:hypothetical protein
MGERVRQGLRNSSEKVPQRAKKKFRAGTEIFRLSFVVIVAGQSWGDG